MSAGFARRVVHGAPGRHRDPLHRRRRINLEKIQQVVAAYVSQPARKEHRKNPVLADGLMQGDDQVLFRDGSFAEKLFHQLVFALGYQLHQSLVSGRGFFAQAHRDLGKTAASAAVRFVDEGLHGHQVHDAAEDGILSVAFDNGQLHRNHLAAKSLASMR